MSENPLGARGATTTAREPLLCWWARVWPWCSSPRFTTGSYEKLSKEQRDQPPPRADSRWPLTTLGVRCRRPRTNELAQCAKKL